MNFLKNLLRSNAAARLLEERLYELVAEEINKGELRPGLWAKALAKSSGNETKAKSLYIEYRVQSMKDEMTISEAPRGNEYNHRKAPQSDWIIVVPCKTERTLHKTLEIIKSLNLIIFSKSDQSIAIGPYGKKDDAGQVLRTLITQYKLDGRLEDI